MNLWLALFITTLLCCLALIVAVAWQRGQMMEQARTIEMHMQSIASYQSLEQRLRQAIKVLEDVNRVPDNISKQVEQLKLDGPPDDGGLYTLHPMV